MIMLKFIIWQILSKQERYDKVYRKMAKMISHLSYVKLNKSGYHIITLPFDKIEFCHKWFNEYGDTKDVPEIKKNSLTLLYENIRQE